MSHEWWATFKKVNPVMPPPPLTSHSDPQTAPKPLTSACPCDSAIVALVLVLSRAKPLSASAPLHRLVSFPGTLFLQNSVSVFLVTNIVSLREPSLIT